MLGLLAFSLVVETGTPLCCGVRAPHGDISCPGARAQGHTDLQFLRRMWDPPVSGTEPMPPASAGGCLSARAAQSAVFAQPAVQVRGSQSLRLLAGFICRVGRLRASPLPAPPQSSGLSEGAECTCHSHRLLPRAQQRGGAGPRRCLGRAEPADSELCS